MERTRPLPPREFSINPYRPRVVIDDAPGYTCRVYGTERARQDAIKTYKAQGRRVTTYTDVRGFGLQVTGRGR